MTHSRVLVFLLTVSSVFCGCSVQPPFGAALQDSVDGNAALIQAQQEMLSLQSDQLGQMNANQLSIVTSLERIQDQLATLQQTRNKSQKAATTKKKSETVTGRKAAAKSVQPVAGKLVVGRNEWVWLDLLGQTFNARIDTGTRTSALNVKEVQPFERNGERWVRFQLVNDENGKEWEAPLVRHVKVRSKANDELDRRPVIKLTVRLGSFVEDTQFTLANRSSMLYPVQLGRDFLRDIAVVDVAKKFTQPKPETQTVAR